MTQKPQQHTPTPWYIERGYNILGPTQKLPFFRHIGGTGGIENPVAGEDAAFIVRAANAHEDLVKALEHQRHRDHPYTDWCDGCALYDKATAKAEGR